jgi:hypothetical protein
MMSPFGKTFSVIILTSALVIILAVAYWLLPTSAPSLPSKEEGARERFSQASNATFNAAFPSVSFGTKLFEFQQKPNASEVAQAPLNYSDKSPLQKNSSFEQAQRPVRNLSDAEIFMILHPPYYLKYLSTLEDLMIEDGWMEKNAKQVFDSEEKVLSFFKNKVYPYAVAKGVITEEDRVRFENGLLLIKKLHQLEADLLRSGARPSQKIGIIAFWEPLLSRIKEELVSRGIIFEIFAPRARAQGLCFQEGAASPTEGSNLAAPCCRCYIGGVPAGCLNAVCEGRAAIWDSTNGICGCGT